MTEATKSSSLLTATQVGLPLSATRSPDSHRPQDRAIVPLNPSARFPSLEARGRRLLPPATYPVATFTSVTRPSGPSREDEGTRLRGLRPAALACVSPQGTRPLRPRAGRQQSKSSRPSVRICRRRHRWAPNRASRPLPRPRPGDPGPACLLDSRGCLSEGRRRAGGSTLEPPPSPPLSLRPWTLRGAKDPQRWVWHSGQRSLLPGLSPRRAVTPAGCHPGGLSASAHTCHPSLPQNGSPLGCHERLTLVYTHTVSLPFFKPSLTTSKKTPEVTGVTS